MTLAKSNNLSVVLDKEELFPARRSQVPFYFHKKKDRYGQIIAVVGMQYGSEAKGSIVSYLAPICDVGVRTGAANAGHTIYYKGEPYVMRQIPATWVNEYSLLVLGVGSIISLDILLKEIELIDKVSHIHNRLFIDENAHVITDDQISREQETKLAERIGSTSTISKEGIGMAMSDKVLRSENCLLAKQVPELRQYMSGTSGLINNFLEGGHIVLLEGTQGFGLSLDHGTFPYVTSRDTSVVALAASMGVAVHEFPIEVIGVTRTYPIRVAGNSGPFGYDSKEITWDDVTRNSGSLTPIIEYTTVTKAVRRVSEFSWRDFEDACRINRPTQIAVTFADYLDASVYNKQEITPPIEEFLEHIERNSGVRVSLVSTGPESTIDFDIYRRNIIRKVDRRHFLRAKVLEIEQEIKSLSEVKYKPNDSQDNN